MATGSKIARKSCLQSALYIGAVNLKLLTVGQEMREQGSLSVLPLSSTFLPILPVFFFLFSFHFLSLSLAHLHTCMYVYIHACMYVLCIE